MRMKLLVSSARQRTCISVVGGLLHMDPDDTWLSVQVLKLLIMQLSTASHYFLPLSDSDLTEFTTLFPGSLNLCFPSRGKTNLCTYTQ
jgi:hypothetical protein